MNSTSGFNHTRDNGDLPDYEKIMISVITYLTVIFLVFLLHVFARCIWVQSVRFTRWRRRRSGSTRPRFYFTGEDPATLPNAGLDSAILETLPMFVYRSQNFTDGLECSVCLHDLEENEKGRLLPNCRHSFHVDCIDTWLLSNSTCPLCRKDAQPEQPILKSTKIEQSATIKIEEPSVTFPAPVASEIHHNRNSEQGQTARSEEEYDLRNPTTILSSCKQEQTSADTDKGTFGEKSLMPHIAIDIPMKPDRFWSTSEGHQLHSPNGSLSSSKLPLTRLRSFTVKFNRDRERKILPPDHPRECDVEHIGPAQGSRVWQRSYSTV